MRKYRSAKTVLDGISFDSKKEAKYWLVLKQRLDEGSISDLQLQVKYELVPAVYEDSVVHLKTKDKVIRKQVQRAIYYVADFVYVDNLTGKTEVVDVKGFRTKEYCLKKKMMRAFKGITIKEV